jgi:hypothetical protein
MNNPKNNPIYSAVIAAFQEAEEMGGVDDESGQLEYVALIDAITEELNTRRATCCENAFYELEYLADAATPTRYSLEGSDGQIDALNAFTETLKLYLGEASAEWANFESYALKATTNEMIGFGLALAEDTHSTNARDKASKDQVWGGRA